MRSVVLLLLATSTWAQVSQVSSYSFQSTLAPDRPGSLALTPFDPLNRNRFVMDSVQGQSRLVYEWGGEASPNANQGGLAYRGLDLFNRNSYSLELMFTFTGGTGAYRRVLDVSNRVGDAALFVAPNNRLVWYSSPAATGGDFAAGQYRHVVMTVNNNELFLYVDGQVVARSTGNFISANVSPTGNPDQLIHLFLDNSSGSNTTEWAPGRIALFRVYSGGLSQEQVTAIYRSPFTSTVGLTLPAFTSAGVVNAASFSATNPITAGGFFTIFGSNLAKTGGNWNAAFTGSLAPRKLNGVRVLVQDQEAFIAFTRADQINVLAPETVPEGPVSVVVEDEGVPSAPVVVQARRIDPALFRFSPNNNRYLASTANDGSAYIAPSNLFGNSGVVNGLPVRPAKPGEFIVLYGCGLGPTNPAVTPSGQIPPNRTGGYPITSMAELQLTNTGGSITRTILPAYAGLSSFAGLYQVVFQVPDVPDGEYQIVLTLGGVASPGGAFVPVQR